MVTDKTTRISARIKTDVVDAMEKKAKDAGTDLSTYIQRTLERSVYDYLPLGRRQELDAMEALFTAAQQKSREVFAAGRFDEHFTLTVFRELMADPKTRNLYASVADNSFPVNMYLGWYIKNAIQAAPLLDEAGKPRRAFVKDGPIKSYTLLTLA